MVKKTRVYGIGKPFEDVFPVPVTRTANPTSSDTNYDLGQVWINTSSNAIYMLASVSSGSATWTLAGPGASDVDTLTGDSGGAISPAAGNITLTGGTNITTVGAANAVTFNLDASITLATSVISPLYTAGAGVDCQITAPTGQDAIIKLGDNAGANKLSVLDSDDAEVFAVDSNGGQTYTTITASGLITAQASMTVSTAGTALNLGSDNSGDAVNLGVGTTARAIGIGDSAAAHTITVGSVTGAASLDLKAGTGNFVVTGAATTNMTIGTGLTSGVITIGATGNTGTLTISPSTAAQTVDIANADGKKTINIGDGVDGNDIDIGNGINTSAQTIDIANGASGADSTVSILSGVGTAGAGVLNLANNTRVTTVDIADIAPAAARTVNVCGGDSAQNDTFNLITGNPSAGTQTVNIMSGTPSGGTQVMNLLTQVGQAGTINIATGAAMANAINIGGTGANVIALGNTQTAGSVAIGDAMTSGTITIGGSGLQTGTITVGGGTGAQIVNLATGGTGAKTVNLGTGAAANVVTVGSTNTTSSLTLQAGTGDITVTGTVKEIDAEFLYSSGTDLTVTQSPVMQTAGTTGGVPTGATGDVNLMHLQDGCLMEQFILGAGQTIIAPRMTANGLNIALDQTSTEGAEYNFGARANAKHAYTIGTSAAFFIEATLYVQDKSGCLPLMVGFRKVEANNATLANYTDYAAIGLNDTTSSTNAVILSELNGGGQTATDTTDTWTENNGEVVKVLVSAAGVVTFELNGSPVSAAPAFTFDNADVVMPFIHFLHGPDVAGEVNMQSLKIGFQA